MARTLPLPLVAPRPLSPFAPLRALLSDWRRRAQERAELAGFDSRELRDVGLTDADRAAILNTPIWREAPRRR